MKHLIHKLMKGMKELSRLMFPLKEESSVCVCVRVHLSVIIYINQADHWSASRCNSSWLCVLQADLLDLPLSGQQHQGPRLRPLLLAHSGHAGGQPVLRLLVSRSGGHFRGGASHDSSPQAALVGLKGGVWEGGEERRDCKLFNIMATLRQTAWLALLVSCKVVIDPISTWLIWWHLWLPWKQVQFNTASFPL